MANWNNTKLTCNNLQRFTEIRKSNPFSLHTAQAYEDKPVELDKDGIVYMQSRNGFPNKEIKQISKENPDLTFIAEYSFESNWNSIIHFVEYKNGQENEIGQKPNYMRTSQGSDAHGYIENIIGDQYKKLMEEAEEIFSRMDTIIKDGIKQVDFVNSEVTLTVENENYQMKLRKTSCQIEMIDCLKKKEVIQYAWVPLEPVNTDDPFNDLIVPFF